MLAIAACDNKKRIKSAVITTHHVNFSFGKAEEQPAHDTRSIIYDAKGEVVKYDIKWQAYNEEQKSETDIKIVYSGDKIIERIITSDGRTETYKYEYDGDKIVKESTNTYVATYEYNGDMIDRIVKQYADDKNVTTYTHKGDTMTLTHWSADGKEKKEEVTLYDDYKILRKVLYKEYYSVESTAEWQGDNPVKCTQAKATPEGYIESSDYQDGIIYTYAYNFDEFGNWTKRVRTRTSKYDSEEIIDEIVNRQIIYF